MYSQNFHEHFWRKVEKTPTCWLWRGVRREGTWSYGILKSRGKNHRAHRLAWELTYGAIPEGCLVLHRCDNPPCVNPAHLFLGTQRENIHDAMTKQRFIPSAHTRGPGNARTHLTWEDIREIRRLYSTGEWSQNALARRFSIRQNGIWSIVHHKTWKET
jgi:hypothetical protein